MNGIPYFRPYTGQGVSNREIKADDHRADQGGLIKASSRAIQGSLKLGDAAFHVSIDYMIRGEIVLSNTIG